MPDLINKFIEGGTVGTSHSAGLPNITGQWGSSTVAQNTLNTISGVFSTSVTKSTTSVVSVSSYSTTSSSWGIDFDASRSSSIYGNSNTVQPASLEMSYIIKF